MNILRPQGKLTYNHPAIAGITTAVGLERDWRPTKEWALQGCDYIEPLGAIAPALLNVTQLPTPWTVSGEGNSAFRVITAHAKRPLQGFEFYDGTAYPAATPLTTYAGVIASQTDWYPNWRLALVRYAPPPDQGIIASLTVKMDAVVRVITDGITGYTLDKNGTWVNGTVVLVLPMAGGDSEANDNPFLAWYVGRTGGTINRINSLSEGSSRSSLDGGLSTEVWCFETIEDSTMFDGGHILIRNSSDPSAWWHTYSENVRVVKGPLAITTQGCRQFFCPIPNIYSNASDLYGGTSTVCAARPNHFLFPMSIHTETPSFDALYSDAPTGSTWTVESTLDNDTYPSLFNGYRPRVTFTPSAAGAMTRPVLWFATSGQEATLAVPSGLPAAEDTEGDGNLYDMSLRVNSTWRGASGSAAFYRRDEAQYEGWLERGQVTMNFGWQADPAPGGTLAAADVATMWIRPGGITRERAGDTELGRPSMAVELGDLVDVRLANTCCVDLGQAGGFTAGSWFSVVLGRAGVPSGMLDIAEGVTDTVIPQARPVPSKPHLLAQDGQSIIQHLDEVCRATNLRWGYNPFTGKAFLDAGKPTYEAGVSTISFTLDYDTVTADSVVFDISHNRSSAAYRNRFKIAWGDERSADTRRFAYYWASNAAEFTAAGGDLWAATQDMDGETVAALIADLYREHRRAFAEVRFATFLRRSLQPDQFVQIADCPELGVEANSVWQITEVAHSVAAGETEVTARLAYSPTGGLVS